MFFQPGGESLVDEAFHNRAHFGRNELVLRLRRKLGIGNLDRENGRQTFTAVLTLQAHLFLFQDARCFGIGCYLACERCTETGHMGAAVALGNVVGKAEHVFMVAVVPPQRDLDRDAVLFATDGDRLVHQRLLGAVQITDEGFKPAVIQQLFLLDIGMALVGEQDTHAGIQERQFA